MSSVTSPLHLRRTRTPRALDVVWDPDPQDLEARIDWSSWYLTDEEDMGEGGEQEQIIWVLKQVLTQLASERGWRNVHIGADQFFAWVESEPLVRVSPDVYLLDHPPPRPLPASWQTWLPGHRPPRLAFEIVSEETWHKDYRDAPKKYAQLGTRELVVYDPEAAAGRARGAEREALHVFRREADSGFVRAYHGAGPARSEELEAWLVVIREGDVATLGVSRDAGGLDLVPTLEQAREQAEQAREQERAAREQERAAREQERAAREQERAAREQAERQLAAALAELERIKRERS
jgi:Uma2 family endonuclease